MFNNQDYAEPWGFSRTILEFREKSWKFLNYREKMFKCLSKFCGNIFLTVGNTGIMTVCYKVPLCVLTCKGLPRWWGWGFLGKWKINSGASSQKKSRQKLATKFWLTSVQSVIVTSKANITPANIGWTVCLPAFCTAQSVLNCVWSARKKGEFRKTRKFGRDKWSLNWVERGTVKKKIIWVSN